MHGTPPPEVEISLELVRALVRDQFPDLAGLATGATSNGWDNVTVRLGDDLAVRLPRRAIAADLAVKEQRWLGAIAERLPVAVPEVVGAGRPALGFPWPWSIVRWVPGTTADEAAVADSEAARYGEVLAALHLPVDPGVDAPINPFRGQEIRLAVFEKRLTDLDTDPATALILHDVVVGGAGTARSAPRWIHGDPHPRNVVVSGGRIVGIIDWGDLTAGDPATDLASAWMIFPNHLHADLFAAYGSPDGATMARSLAWAAHFGVMLALIHDDPSHGRVGRRTIERVIATANGDDTIAR